MKITVLGAAGDVTGSGYLVETASARVLVDYGLFQGAEKNDALNAAPPPFDASKLDAVILTHAHLDHSGRLPLLTKAGYTGPIYATAPTRELTGILFKDCANIQAEEVNPLFTLVEAAKTFLQFQDLEFWEAKSIAPGIHVRLRDSGHIIGSASVEMAVEEDGRVKRVVFSGDIGPKGAPILRDPSPPTKADLVILESTYGDIDHPPQEDTAAQFAKVLKRAEAEGHRVLTPAFAVGRAQTLLYHIAQLYSSGELKDLPVYLDSPMGAAATDLYASHPELFDAETRELFKAGKRPLDFPKLRTVMSGDESRALNVEKGPMVIIAGSGMCNAGRIVSHLREHLNKPETQVVFTGFQANGTLGREIADGRSPVKVKGQAVEVKAQRHMLRGFSAHAGQSDLVAWARDASEDGPRFALTHGEDGPRATLKGLLESELKVDVGLPSRGDVLEV